MEVFQVRNVQRIYWRVRNVCRASIWWKYLDHNSILPPPFTIIFIIHAVGKKITNYISKKVLE